jgi:hypothetical protein
VGWFSPDGETWLPATGPALSTGIPRGLVAWHGGFVTVGLNGTDSGAAVWVSGAGGWHAVADQDAFRYDTNPLRMLDVTVAGSTLVAVGWRSDAGNGSAVAWTSRDGSVWTRDPVQPMFYGATASAAATTAGGSVAAVGTAGYPDNDAAAVWMRASP